METWMVLFVVGIVFAAAAAVAWVVVGRSRSAGLKRKFGTEYEHAVQASGSRSRGEADLASRTKRMETLDIRPLSSGDHDRFAERWRSVQASFVDNPAAAVSDAEKLVEEVMRARGYPIGDFDQRAADLSVDHLRFVENYRHARDITLAGQRGTAKTEDLRQATVHYRALFEELLDTTDRKLVELRR